MTLGPLTRGMAPRVPLVKIVALRVVVPAVALAAEVEMVEALVVKTIIGLKRKMRNSCRQVHPSHPNPRSQVVATPAPEGLTQVIPKIS